MHTTGILKFGRINAKLYAVVHLGRDKGLKHKLSLRLDMPVSIFTTKIYVIWISTVKLI